MFDRFRVFFAEQATADEAVVFLLVTSLVALLLAFALYSAVLAVLWRGSLRKVTTLPSLLFPSRKQLGRYLGEYVLAAGTSALLTLTVAARHDVVQTVLDYPLHEVDTEQIRAAFPFGELQIEDMVGAVEYDPDVASTLTSLATANVGSGAGVSSFGVESLLLPSVRAGGTEYADLWLRGVISDIGPGTLMRFPTETHLLAFAVFLLLGYVGWFALARTRAIQSAGGAGDTDHGRVLGRLLVPAVCIALLLASAASVADAERISARATAVAGLELGLDEEGRYAANLLTHAMSHQVQRSRPFRFASEADDTLPGVGGAIERLDARVRDVYFATATLDSLANREIDAIRTGITVLGARLERDSVFSDGERIVLGQRTDFVEADLASSREQVAVALEQSRDAARQAAATADSVTLVRRRIAGLESIIGALQNDLRRLASMLPGDGLLLVVTTPAIPYEVVGGPGGATRANGSGIGLHSLPPGQYSISSRVGTGVTTIVASEARTVQLAQRVVDTGIGGIDRAVVAQPIETPPPPLQD